jgi:hypothetical protein
MKVTRLSGRDPTDLESTETQKSNQQSAQPSKTGQAPRYTCIFMMSL